jgi:hypothetical protein
MDEFEDMPLLDAHAAIAEPRAAVGDSTASTS